jgi:hypothetical protein
MLPTTFAPARWVSDFARDLGYGIRVLRRNPTFALVAIATLALTFGANTAMFSLMHKILIAQLPVRDPEQLVLLSRSNLEQAHRCQRSHAPTRLRGRTSSKTSRAASSSRTNRWANRV